MKTQKFHATAIKNASGQFTVFLTDTPCVVIQSPSLKDAGPKLFKLLSAYNNYLVNQSEEMIEFKTEALA